MTELTTDRRLRELVDAGMEDEHIDFKQAMSWDGGENSAKLAKHIAAFANSQAGGVLIIGVTEIEPGQFRPTGLDPDQSKSFETTIVSQWINSRFSPEIRLRCRQFTHGGFQLVGIEVSEFDDLPAICVKEYPPQLSKGALYTRVPGAKSEPIQTADALRRVVGLATKKKHDQFARTLYSLMEGVPDRSLRQDEYQSELDGVEAELDSFFDPPQGCWTVLAYPAHPAVRFAGRNSLQACIEQTVQHPLQRFPAWRTETVMSDSGLTNSAYGPKWLLTERGVFAARQPFNENKVRYEPTWMPAPPARAPGSWIEYDWQYRTVIDFVRAAAAVLEVACEPGESVNLRCSATGLSGRELLTLNFRIRVPQQCRCEASAISHTFNGTVEALATGWIEEAGSILFRFFSHFGEGSITEDVVRSRARRFSEFDD